MGVIFCKRKRQKIINSKDEFDEEKAKELIKYLLSSDLKFYKNQLDDVINLNSEEFQKLFNGDSDYNYNVKNKNNFKKLAVKIENFSILNKEWYQNDIKYYECLQSLWNNFIDLYSLKDLEEVDLEKKLNCTNYLNWDEKIKNEFKIIIKNSFDMSDKFKIFIEENYKELEDVIIELLKSKKSIEIINEDEKSKNCCITKNIDNIIHDLLENLIPFYLESLIEKKENKDENKKTEENDNKNEKIEENDNKNEKTEEKIEEIDNKNEKNEEKDKNEKIKEKDNESEKDSEKKILTKNAIQNLIKNVSKIYITGKIPEDFDSTKTLKEISLLLKNFNIIKFNQNNNKDKNLIDNKLIAYGILGLSFSNLCYNIYSTHMLLKNSEVKIDELDNRLKKIKENYQRHKNEIETLSTKDIEESLRKIEEIRLKFEEDKAQIRQLIEDIEQEIKNQNSEINNNFFKIFTSIGMMTLNTYLSYKSSNSKEYGLAAVNNGISAACDVYSIEEIKKNISKLQKILNEAKNEEDNINKGIKELCKEYINYQKKIAPKIY